MERFQEPTPSGGLPATCRSGIGHSEDLPLSIMIRTIREMTHHAPQAGHDLFVREQEQPNTTRSSDPQRPALPLVLADHRFIDMGRSCCEPKTGQGLGKSGSGPGAV